MSDVQSKQVSEVQGTQPRTNALMIIFPGFNTFDMNGPYEIFRDAQQGDAIGITVASETEITQAAEGTLVKVGNAFSRCESVDEHVSLRIP